MNQENSCRFGRAGGVVGSLLVCLLAIAGSGCSGDGFSRVPVGGAVTLDGKPVQTGTFSMTPPVEDSDRPTVHGMVADGQYRLQKAQGPVPGKYFIHITVYATSATTDGEGGEGSSSHVKELGTYSTEIVVPETGSDSLDVPLVSRQQSREPV